MAALARDVARLAAAAGLAAAVLAGGATAQTPDTRQRLALPAPARDAVLAEMRRMLESVNRVLAAVAAGNLRAAEVAARASGMAMAADVDPTVMRALPAGFRELGMQTHRGFDALADRLKAGGTVGDAVGDLARVTSLCVACHAAYRFE
jgi:hypothetical protein